MSSFPFEQRRPFCYQSIQQEPPKKHDPEKHPPKHGVYAANPTVIGPHFGPPARVDVSIPGLISLAIYQVTGDFMTITSNFTMFFPASGDGAIYLTLDLPPGYIPTIPSVPKDSSFKDYSFILSGPYVFGMYAYDASDLGPGKLRLVINPIRGTKFEGGSGPVHYTLTIPVTHVSH